MEGASILMTGQTHILQMLSLMRSPGTVKWGYFLPLARHVKMSFSKERNILRVPRYVQLILVFFLFDVGLHLFPSINLLLMIHC